MRKKKIVVIALCVITGLSVLTGCTKKNDLDKNRPTKNDNTKVVEYFCHKFGLSKKQSVIAITENRKLYVIGEQSSGELGIKINDEITKPTKVKSNVEKFFPGMMNTYYIDEKGNAYQSGFDIYNQTFNHSFTKFYSDVKDMSITPGSETILKNDNTLYIRLSSATHYGSEYSNITKNEFVKVAENVKSIGSSETRITYITENDELMEYNTETSAFEKIADNVKTNNYNLILKNNGELYGYISNEESKYVPVKVDDNVKSISKNTYVKKDGSVYKTLNNFKVNINKKDIKEILYLNDETPDGTFKGFDYGEYIYVNNKGKIVMHDSTGDKTIDNNIASIEAVFKFINKSENKKKS